MPLVEVTLTKCPTRAGLEIALEANRSRFLLECQVGFELPRTVLRRMSIDVGLMLPQIVGGADVEMTGHSKGLKNVDVVHRRLFDPPSSRSSGSMARVPFALGGCFR